MKTEDFNRIVERRIGLIQSVLLKKAGEYASTTDRFHNFKIAALLESTPQTPEQALWGMLKKHLVSVIDMIDATGRGDCPSEQLRDEKIGDSINYLLLLEGLLEDEAQIAALKELE